MLTCWLQGFRTWYMPGICRRILYPRYRLILPTSPPASKTVFLHYILGEPACHIIKHKSILSLVPRSLLMKNLRNIATGFPDPLIPIGPLQANRTVYIMPALSLVIIYLR